MIAWRRFENVNGIHHPMRIVHRHHRPRNRKPVQHRRARWKAPNTCLCPWKRPTNYVLHLVSSPWVRILRVLVMRMVVGKAWTAMKTSFTNRLWIFLRRTERRNWRKNSAFKRRNGFFKGNFCMSIQPIDFSGDATLSLCFRATPTLGSESGDSAVSWVEKMRQMDEEKRKAAARVSRIMLFGWCWKPSRF